MSNPKLIISAVILLALSSCRKDPDILLELPEEDVVTAPIYLIDQSSEWIYRYYWSDGNPTPGMELVVDDTVNYFFEGDTILERFTKWDYNDISSTIESHKYMRLKFEKKSTQLYPWPGGTSYHSGVMAYVRVDTASNRIFFTHGEQHHIANLDSTYEAILYDFSLTEGDTLPYNYWNGGVSNDYIIEEVEYLNLGSFSLKAMKAYNNQVYYHGTIYEGIGGLEGLERKHFGGDSHLIHFENDDFSYNP